MKGGPWPERVGAHGVVVTGGDVYPFHGISEHEMVILLDADPLLEPHDPERPYAWRSDDDLWSCVMRRDDLTAELW